jgi:hypothetical protein
VLLRFVSDAVNMILLSLNTYVLFFYAASMSLYDLYDMFPLPIMNKSYLFVPVM